MCRDQRCWDKIDVNKEILNGLCFGFTLSCPTYSLNTITVGPDAFSFQPNSQIAEVPAGQFFLPLMKRKLKGRICSQSKIVSNFDSIVGNVGKHLKMFKHIVCHIVWHFSFFFFFPRGDRFFFLIPYSKENLFLFVFGTVIFNVKTDQHCI